MSVRVFISYRRDDNRDLAGRLRDRLVVAFGAENVFYDVDSIPFGHDFRRVIGERIPAADDLPGDLDQLAYLHAAPLRPDPDFHPDTQRLVDSLTATLATTAPKPPTTPAPAKPRVAPRPTPASPYDKSVVPRRWTLIDQKGGPQALAVAGYSRDLGIWDAPAGFVAREIGRLEARVQCLAWAPDGTRSVTGGPDGSLRTFDTTGGGTPTGVIRAHTGGVSSVAWSPDGRLIASGGLGQDPTARFWRPDGTAVRTLRVHTGAVRGVAFSPDGTRLVTASVDRRVGIWDVATGELLTALWSERQDCWSVAVSPDGRLVAVGGSGKRVEVWDRLAEQLVWSLTGLTTAVHAVAFSPDGKYLASAGGILIRRRTQVFLWELGG